MGEGVAQLGVLPGGHRFRRHLGRQAVESQFEQLQAGGQLVFRQAGVHRHQGLASSQALLPLFPDEAAGRQGEQCGRQGGDGQQGKARSAPSVGWCSGR